MIDVHSETWVEVRDWAEAQIKMHDRQLRKVGLPLDQTEGHRYAIRELEALVKLPNPSKLTPAMTSAV